MRGPVRDIVVSGVRCAADRRAWLDLPERLYRGDPSYIAPLRFRMRQRIDAKRNPFFRTGEAQLFLARERARPVGRISAHFSRPHLERYRDGTGHFGFLECADETAGRALLKAAEQWLSERSLRRVSGPFEFSINEELGLLVDGFETPPSFLMTHAQPTYAALLENAGYQGEKDLLAYRVNLREPLPNAAERFARFAMATSRVAFRNLDMGRYRADIATMVEIFNDAWADNWGFLPVTDHERDHMARALRPLARGELVHFAEIEGEPVGTIVAIPNLNEAIADFRGRLLPFNWLKLILRLPRIGSARVMLLGIRRKLRSTRWASVIASGLVGRLLVVLRSRGFAWAELSWVIADNQPMTEIGAAFGGAPAKTYRIYSKDLEACGRI